MTNELITHLRAPAPPLSVRRTGAITWPDQARHNAAYLASPVDYALAALLPGVTEAQRARMLLRLLDASWAGHDAATRATLSRVVRVLTLALPGTVVLTVLLALRHRRANHKHVTGAALRLLYEHPHAPQLLHTHRRVLTAGIEHGLGRNTARGAAQAPGAPARLRGLYGPAEYSAPPATAPLLELDHWGERPDTVTATNRGDLAATLVHQYRGGVSATLTEALDGYLAAATAGLPTYPGHLALVLDESPSMRGYGEREWAVHAQAQALRMVLERQCAQLSTVHVNGGVTDLATGVLDALAGGPDLVAVVSDGYENAYPGDLARLTATLPRLGVRTPVVFCHSTYGHSDDLTLRRPAPALPEQAFWHEADFGPLLLWLLSQTPGAQQWLRAALLNRLSTVEGVAT